MKKWHKIVTLRVCKNAWFLHIFLKYNKHFYKYYTHCTYYRILHVYTPHSYDIRTQIIDRYQAVQVDCSRRNKKTLSTGERTNTQAITYWPIQSCFLGKLIVISVAAQALSLFKLSLFQIIIVLRFSSYNNLSFIKSIVIK